MRVRRCAHAHPRANRNGTREVESCEVLLGGRCERVLLSEITSDVAPTGRLAVDFEQLWPLLSGCGASRAATLLVQQYGYAFADSVSYTLANGEARRD